MNLPDVPHHIVPTQHAALDIGSLILIVLSALGVMPGIAASLAVIWYALLIYDRLWHGRQSSK